MEQAATERGRAQSSADSSAGRIIGGLALLVPVVLLWIVALLRPTLRTLSLSRHNVRLGNANSPSVGFANYSRVFDDAVFRAAREFTTLITIERVLIVAFVPLLLALGLNEFGRIARIPLRLLFTIPLALFAPVSVALMWLLAYNPQYGLFGTGRPVLADQAQARGALLRMDAFTTLGIACALGLIIYLIALRGPGAAAPTGRRVGPPLLITWLVLIFATIALALQSFTPSFVLTRGGPANRTNTLALLEYTYTFQNLQLGLGATVATLIMLLPALLGVITAVLIAASGLRLTVVPARKPVGLLPPSRKPLAAIGLALVGLGSVAAIFYGDLPTIWTGLTSLKGRAEVFGAAKTFFPSEPIFDAYARVAQAIPGGQSLGNTVLPVLIGVLCIQLPIAYLGALGIGALRPLGRYSEWLLLPFSPWLFITALPLGVANFQRLQGNGGLNRFISLIPSATYTIPLLFILTLGFKGGAVAWQAARDAGQPAGSSFLRHVILPSLPLAALLALATILIGMQDLFWPLVVTNSANLRTIPLALTQLTQQFATDVPLVAAAIWRLGLPRFLLLLPLFGLFQVFYLDRLALVTGMTPPPAPPRRGEG